MAKNIERIVIINHDNHTVIFEDIDVDELQKKYGGEEEKFIEDNHKDLDNYSWDYITSVKYIPGTNCEPIDVSFEGIKKLASAQGCIKVRKKYWFVKISKGRYAGTLMVHCREKTPKEVIELLQDVYTNTEEIMTAEEADEATIKRFADDGMINEM